MKCASCKHRIEGKPHELIPTLIRGRLDTRRMHAICSPACMEMCLRGTTWVQAGPFFHVTDHLRPDQIEAIVVEHGRQAYEDWEAERGLAISERVN